MVAGTVEAAPEGAPGGVEGKPLGEADGLDGGGAVDRDAPDEFVAGADAVFLGADEAGGRRGRRPRRARNR